MPELTSDAKPTKPDAKVGYPWQEHCHCRGCGRLYLVDYRIERDWSLCPVCIQSGVQSKGAIAWLS